MKVIKHLSLMLIILAMTMPQVFAQQFNRKSFSSKRSVKSSRVSKSSKKATLSSSKISSLKRGLSRTKKKTVKVVEKPYDPNSVMGKLVKKCYDKARELKSAAESKYQACLDRIEGEINAMSNVEFAEFLDGLPGSGSNASKLAKYQKDTCDGETSRDYSSAENKLKSCHSAAKAASDGCNNLKKAKDASKKAYAAKKKAREKLEKLLAAAKKAEKEAKEKYEQDTSNHSKMCNATK